MTGMRPVEELWAKREAEKRWPDEYSQGPNRATALNRQGAEWMAGHLAALLLSDEAVEAASAVLADSHDVGTTDCTRRALQAALTKITEEKK